MIDGSQTAGRFVDRHSAGRQLADALEPLISSQDTVILALPRGGVPVAYEVAHRLGAPLDVLLVRKLASPGSQSWHSVLLLLVTWWYSTRIT